LLVPPMGELAVHPRDLDGDSDGSSWGFVGASSDEAPREVGNNRLGWEAGKAGRKTEEGKGCIFCRHGEAVVT
jgi:hypothetical protein